MIICFSIITIVCIACGQSGSADAKPQVPDNMPVNIKAEPTPSPQTKKGDFEKNLPKDFVMPTDDVGRLLLREYGAMLVARDGIKPPNKVMFREQAEVLAFQKTLDTETDTIGGFAITLQKPALKALREAIADAKKKGVTIAPRKAGSAERSYQVTETNWKSRVEKGLIEWGKDIPKSEIDRIRSLAPRDQVADILAFEQKGMFFSQQQKKSIIYSVAVPGASQHISMLALDISAYDKPAAIQIMNDHGWFQTVTTDLPHFTYLGVKKEELPSLGLMEVEVTDPETKDTRKYWKPNL